jgi:hypothetical protein
MATQTTLIEALVAAQAEMPNPPLDGTNPHFRSKFSTLLSVLDTIKPVLNRHGIHFSQTFAFDAGAGPVLQTILRKGNESIVSSAPIPALPDVQKWAGAVTYIRRISALAVCGIVGDPDADAEDVVRAPEQKRDLGPHPDTDFVPVELVAKYASAFRDRLAKGNFPGVLQVHDDLNAEGQSEYSAVWKQLGSAERAAIKEAIAKARDAKAKF